MGHPGDSDLWDSCSWPEHFWTKWKVEAHDPGDAELGVLSRERGGHWDKAGVRSTQEEVRPGLGIEGVSAWGIWRHRD